MQILKDLRQLFLIFHDGVVTEIKGGKERLILTITCQYLAEDIDPNYKNFFVELMDIEHFALNDGEGMPDDLEENLRKAREILKMAPEIVSAQIENNFVVVTLQLNSRKVLNLELNAKEIDVFDHQKKKLSLETLTQLATNYWEGLKKT